MRTICEDFGVAVQRHRSFTNYLTSCNGCSLRRTEQEEQTYINEEPNKTRSRVRCLTDGSALVPVSIPETTLDPVRLT